MKTKKKAHLLLVISLIVSLIAIAGIVIVLHTGNIREETGSPAETTAGTEAAEASEKPIEPADTLFFASDYQAEDGWDAPAETLDGILKQVSEDGKTLTNAIFCGDYTNDLHLHDYQLSPDESIEEIRGVVASDCSSISQDDIIFVQGNHDQLTASITAEGLHEYDNYLVYVLNTEYGFPWKQGRDTLFRERVIDTAAEMQECFNKLAENEETRPLFIAGHVPLHFTARTSSRHSTGDNMYAEYVFDAVNKAAESLDIVYLVGHNHSKGWDCYLGGSSIFKRLGDTILIPEAGVNTANTDSYTIETLNFTYMNAGYLGYYMNCGPEELDNGTYDTYHAADETLTGSVCEIMPDELIISRYSADGLHSLAWDGEGDPYKNYIDSDLIGEESYSIRVNSPVHIPRKSNSKS